MVGIRKHVILLGSKVRTVEEIATFCGYEEHENMRKIGLNQIPTDNLRPLEDMIHEAAARISVTPDCIFIAHSLPFIRTDCNTWMPCGDSVPAFFLSGLPCAILHKAIAEAAKLLYAHRYRRILVIGADKAYSDQERVFFHTIMGDAVVALLLENNCEEHQLLSSHISTTIIAAHGENSSEDDIARFRANNIAFVRSAMKQCMKKARLDHVDYIVPHTSNSKFWDGVAEFCRIPRDRFLDENICCTGHLNSNDSMVHYFHWCEQGVIRPGDTALLVNPGFGGTQGCTIIRR